ncbi:MAG: hypothetical protein RLZZ303_3368 [Candidatus Hydrogenedentota bacterium]
MIVENSIYPHPRFLVTPAPRCNASSAAPAARVMGAAGAAEDARHRRSGCREAVYGFAYNGANDLTTMTEGGVTTTYTYDDWGRTISKADGTHSATHGWRSSGSAAVSAARPHRRDSIRSRPRSIRATNVLPDKHHMGTASAAGYCGTPLCAVNVLWRRATEASLMRKSGGEPPQSIRSASQATDRGHPLQINPGT